MVNILKSELYHFVRSELQTKGMAKLGGQDVVRDAASLINSSLDNCCLGRIKTRNVFLNTFQNILSTYNLTNDKRKLQFVADYISGVANCCLN